MVSVVLLCHLYIRVYITVYITVSLVFADGLVTFICLWWCVCASVWSVCSQGHDLRLWACGDQRTASRSWFCPSTEGSGVRAQFVRLVWQTLLSAEPSHGPFNFLMLTSENSLYTDGDWLATVPLGSISDLWWRERDTHSVATRLPILGFAFSWAMDKCVIMLGWTVLGAAAPSETRDHKSKHPRLLPSACAGWYHTFKTYHVKEELICVHEIFNTLLKIARTSVMAQQAKVLATKPNDPSFIPSPPIKWKIKLHKLFSDLHTRLSLASRMNK